MRDRTPHVDRAPDLGVCQRALSTVKVIAARGMTNPLVGATINRFARDVYRVHGLTIGASAMAVSDRVRAHLFWQFYERAEIRMLREHLPRDLDVIECGSSIGVVASAILQHVDPGSRIVCVEADRRLLELLYNNLNRNGDASDVDIICAAIVAGEDDPARLHISESTGGRTVDSGGAVAVRGLTLSTVVQTHDLARYSLVCDIEGAEACIIFGDPESLDGCQFALFEFHFACYRGRSLSPADLRSGVLRLGFEEVAAHGNVHAFRR